MTPTSCEHCHHDWHGLTCEHRAVVRDGWWMAERRCACAGATPRAG